MQLPRSYRAASGHNGSSGSLAGAQPHAGASLDARDGRERPEEASAHADPFAATATLNDLSSASAHSGSLNAMDHGNAPTRSAKRTESWSEWTAAPLPQFESISGDLISSEMGADVELRGRQLSLLDM
jgi:hypothetical protein